MTDIFLSYAHEDRARIEPLVAELERRGWDVWWDKRIHAGTQFDVEIESILESTRCVIVVWSKYSIASTWVRSEAHEGMDRGILVPVLLDDVRAPMPFRQIQAQALFSRHESRSLLDDNLITSIEGAFSGRQDFTPSATPEAKLQSAPARIVDSKPSIAVLPFRPVSRGEDEAYLADGIAEDLIVNLSYSRLFPVISSATSFRFRDSKLGVMEIGSQLNTKYLITGTVGKSKDKVRITVSLDDCESERQLWSDRYTVSAIDLFELQEEMADTLIAKLDPAIRAVEISRVRRAPPSDFAAWDHVLRGLWHYNKYSKDENNQAIAAFSEAITIDPDFANAHTMLALAYYNRSYMGWSDEVTEDFARAARQAQKAVDLDPELAEAYLILTFGALLERKFDLSEELANRAIDLNPCNGHCWLGVGLVNLYRGRYEEANRHFERVERLNPNDPVRWLFHIAAGLSALMSGEYGDALQHANKARTQALGRGPGDLIACGVLSALERDDEARAIIANNKSDSGANWAGILRRIPFESPEKLQLIKNLIARIEPGIFD